uniref:Uncharacterized protein n=1 Tax=Tanacetum cinerariifolium TaxID=118510 RepID=A0A699H9K1_TANCI|nr:hypothetical protein [Tanacetum cinerariifolium]
MKDPDVATEFFGTPSAIEKSLLDFDNENPSPPMTEGKGTEDQAHETVAPEIPPGKVHATGAASEVNLEEEIAAMGPRLSKRRRRRVNDGADTNAPPKVFRDFDRKCGYHGSTRHSLCEKCRVREIDLLPIHGWVTLRIQVREDEIKNLDQEVQGLQNQTSNLKTLLEAELTQQVSTLQTQVTGEERIRAAFEEFKKYKDDRVEKCCAEIDARLDALSINFDEELYPHMLTAIASRRWVIGHGMRLAVMNIEHEKVGRDLEVVEAYDPEANNGTPRAKRSEVRDPRDPWVVKEDMLLEEAITANVSRVEKKKRCRVVCRTHVVGSAHHARYDGIHVSVPTIAPQGLAILPADAATQTEASEDAASPRLLRSKSLLPMYNLDWP